MEHSKMYNDVVKRLDTLSKLPSMNKDKNIKSLLEENGISRRDFMKWAAGMTAALSLPSTFTPLMAQAAQLTDKIPVLWLHMAECTGCSESLLRTASPDVASLIFDYISLEYHETVMAASGWQAEELLEQTIEKYKGKYILMVEGGIPAGQSEFFLTIGPHAHKGAENARKAAKNAMAIFAIGTCSSFGGIQAAAPNPTNAQPLSKITDKPVINVPGCPPSDTNIIGNVLNFILFGSLPSLDVYNRPKWAYGLRIHDLCERRGHFDAGEFVQEFGDEGAKQGFCLYKVGCKGPYTFNNCSRERFNQHTSWPIQAGHGCIGCSEPDFWDNMGPFEKPLGDRLYETAMGGIGVDKTADSVGIALLAATGVAIAAHAAIAAFKKPKEEEM